MMTLQEQLRYNHKRLEKGWFIDELYLITYKACIALNVCMCNSLVK